MQTGQFCTHGSWQGFLFAADVHVLAAVSGVLPAEFAGRVVVDAEMVGDPVDDGAPDPVSDPLLAAAGNADRLDGRCYAVGQDSHVLRRATGERDAPGKARAGRASPGSATRRGGGLTDMRQMKTFPQAMAGLDCVAFPRLDSEYFAFMMHIVNIRWTKILETSGDSQ
jgi:hypothetical protein